MNKGPARGRFDSNYNPNNNPNYNNYNNKQDTRTCFNCAKSGHLASFQGCPARGKKCNICQRIGHFGSTCRKRKGEFQARDNQYEKKQRLTTALLEEDNENYTEKKNSERYLFYTGGGHKIQCKVGGVRLEMLIDSGSDANVLGHKEWTRLKAEGIKVFEDTERVFKGYANQERLKVLGRFKATVEIGRNKIYDVFYVIEEGQRSLLGRETALKLGVLKLGLDVNEVKRGELKKEKKKFKTK